jgi:hypothetical protein
MDTRPVFFSILLLVACPTFARQNSDQRTDVATATECKNLDTIGGLVEVTWYAQQAPETKAVPKNAADDGIDFRPDTLVTRLTLPEDTLWDSLIGCSQATKIPSERAEALRVAAIWERLRPDAFQKVYLTELAANRASAPAAQSKSGNDDDLDAFVAERNKQRAAVEQENIRLERARRGLMSDPSAWVAISFSDRLSDDELHATIEHNRAVCDQVIVVTELTAAGLVLNYGSPDALTFLKKNYPRVCVLEDTTRFVPGVPRYLLVYANSKEAFMGFQPVQQTSSSPVYGSGTVRNPSGKMSRFSFSGTIETTGQVQTPYTINSQSLFLYAYGEDGHTVSQRFITTSSQVGGDPAYAAGYNVGNLIARKRNSPQKLAVSVLDDIQRDSKNYIQ